jgi:DASH complex subunit ASK1
MFQPPTGGVASSTPLPGRHGGSRSWEDSIESPFDRMDRKLREELRLDEGYAESSNSMPTPSLPSGYSLPAFAAADASYDVSTGTAEPRGQSSSGRSSSAHADGDTPKAKRAESTKWNGLTDLRNTPLNAKFAKSKGKFNANKPKLSLVQTLADLNDSDDDLKMTISPPVTMNFTLPPRAQAVMNTGRTPVKLASKQSLNQKSEGEARMILDDLLEEMGSMDSPHMPTPEAFGRYSTAPEELGSGRRLFTGIADDGPGSSKHDATGATTRKSLANTSYGSDILDQPNDLAPVYPDDDSFDEDDSFDSAFGGPTTHGQYNNNAATNEDYANVTGSSAGNDSVFGVPAHLAGGSGFNIMQQDEMQTYGGGRLEDAGDEVHHSPTFARGNRR